VVMRIRFVRVISLRGATLVCVHACVRKCVCVSVCVRACVRACVCSLSVAPHELCPGATCSLYL
jgi:hypothetical protein